MICSCKDDGQIIYFTDDGKIHCSICNGIIVIEN